MRQFNQNEDDPMKTLAVSAILLGAGLSFASAPAHAMPRLTAANDGAPIIHVAHAGEPYKNVDHRNDAGNDTGDSQVEKLNEESLKKAQAK